MSDMCHADVTYMLARHSVQVLKLGVPAAVAPRMATSSRALNTGAEGVAAAASCITAEKVPTTWHVVRRC